jgi:thiol-disulfide isomerase/thioredoxin
MVEKHTDRSIPEDAMKRQATAVMAAALFGGLLLSACTSTADSEPTQSDATESAAMEPSASAVEPDAMDSDAMDSKPSGGAMEDSGSDSSAKSDGKSMSDDKSGAMTAPSGYVEYSDYTADSSKYDAADVVLFFNATWCPTCQEADKQLESANFPDDLVVVSVDYDENGDLKQKYGVTTQHTFVQVDSDGKELTKFTGSTTVDEIEEQLA